MRSDSWQKTLRTIPEIPALHSRCRTFNDILISSSFPRGLETELVACPLLKAPSSLTLWPISVRSRGPMSSVWTSIFLDHLADSYRLLNVNMVEKGEKEPRSSLPKTVITFICWQMPPNYLRRFKAAYSEYRRSLQQESWYSFLDNVKKERANANVIVSGLFSIMSLTRDVSNPDYSPFSQVYC